MKLEIWMDGRVRRVFNASLKSLEIEGSIERDNITASIPHPSKREDDCYLVFTRGEAKKFAKELLSIAEEME